MPNFYFSRDEAKAVAGYILSASQEESGKWLESHQAPSGVDPGNAALVAKGEELANSLGCRGCHGFAEGETPVALGESKDVVPNLSRIAEKTNPRWMYHWLKNPRGYSAEARMPSLRLSDDEARALVSYLLTLGKRPGDDSATRATLLEPENVATGEKLVRKYGCPGCHTIAGMEEESRVSVELTVFGSKPLEELYFGNRTDIPHTWRDWTFNKINEPRIYETERIEQAMPHFALEKRDIQDILIFLSSRKEGKVPETYQPASIEREKTLVEGRRVVEHYNCIGCHVIAGKGGAILARYEENPTLGPPILTGEGAKVQAEWLYGFLQRPVPLRPWLAIRMPTFGMSQEEALKLVRYFAAQDGIDNPFVYVDKASLSPEYVEAGELLASVDYFSCWTCHQQGDKKPEGPQEGWAPDLAMAHDRLNPDWIVEWIKNPQALMPGTRMPSFYDFSDDARDGPEDVLSSDLEQVKALRDYLLTLHTGGNTTTVAVEAATPAEEAAPDEMPSDQTAATEAQAASDAQTEG
jgi:mono/diheme cytochrome c family protein